ncbi:nitrous oxide reductase accessory protein NosL [Sulfurovum sp.]|uniref:nitrous oxide reductase accessory protein NosL n=1 Tax=Sulfurovum sp. TaxID=1969726 RepID=UPI002867B55C|nr:nitrous oxide reductase accessory protein NosL [Sulfurovum sp.]
MTRFFLALFLLSGLMYAEDISPAKYAKLVQKGEKVALKLCDETKLSQIKSKTVTKIIQEIDTVNPCLSLNSRNKEALAYFLMAGSSETFSSVKGQMQVPKSIKCPVCGMFVAKYPKWAALITEKNNTHYFDGVKDMMKFYIFDVDFPYDRTKISNIEVTDFYTLKAIDAKKAFYVLGSDVFGPMGNELIPFLTKDAAQNFMKDHNGDKIIIFDEITPKLVMGLDGLEYP